MKYSIHFSILSIMVFVIFGLVMMGCIPINTGGTVTVNGINADIADGYYLFAYVYSEGETDLNNADKVLATNHGEIISGTVSFNLEEDDGEWLPNGNVWIGEAGVTYDIYIYSDSDNDGDPTTGEGDHKQMDPFPVAVTIAGDEILELDYADFVDYVFDDKPILSGFSPALSYIREGDTGFSIPTALMVSLSAPAQGDTVVNLMSDDPASLGVPTSVIIPDGDASASVILTGLAQTAAVQVTASLGSVNLNANVRVIGIMEQPQIVALSPATASVPINTTKDFEVVLDIPAANPEGNIVNIALNPGTAGSAPGTVLVSSDQLSAVFSFTAEDVTGIEEIVASLGINSAIATVNVIDTLALVINEVDYDQPSSDSEEFVELYNNSSSIIDLNGLALVFVNGNNNTEYNRVDLSGYNLSAGQYLVVGSLNILSQVPISVIQIPFSGITDKIQNGAPDAVAILDTATGQLVDALSYEGSITAASVTGVAGTLNFVEGTATTALDNNSSEGSLCRLPHGSDTDDAITDWSFSTTITPGSLNVP